MILTKELRPKNLDGIIGQEHIIRVMKGFVKAKEIPDMILNGPYGCGKTSTIRALAIELYDGDLEGNYMEINASDLRGIDAVRGPIKRFAKEQSALSLEGLQKLLVCDEADQMTIDAQKALRGIVENMQNTCKFAFIGNEMNPENFYEALFSRCTFFNFRPLAKETVMEYLDRTCKKYNIELGEDLIKEIVKSYGGDLRRILNNPIQIALATEPPYTLEGLLVIPDDYAVAKELYTTIKNIGWHEARKSLHETLRDRFIPRRKLIGSLYEVLEDDMKYKTAQIFSIVDNRLKTAGNEAIHLDYLMKVIADAASE